MSTVSPSLCFRSDLPAVIPLRYRMADLFLRAGAWLGHRDADQTVPARLVYTAEQLLRDGYRTPAAMTLRQAIEQKLRPMGLSHKLDRPRTIGNACKALRQAGLLSPHSDSRVASVIRPLNRAVHGSLEIDHNLHRTFRHARCVLWWLDLVAVAESRQDVPEFDVRQMARQMRGGVS